jgi:hypothetical protein
MSVTFSISLDSGKKWNVGSNVCSSADVIVPVDQLDGMTDAEIGDAVRKAIPFARLAHAEEIANQYGYYMSERFHIGLAQLVIRNLGDDFHFLEEHEDQSEEVRQTLEFVRRCKELVEMRAQGEQTKKKVRQEVALRYDTLFVSVGKRDGFQCRVCNSSVNLTLDHIQPVSLGGDNELGNLAILCRSHNSSKGATI